MKKNQVASDRVGVDEGGFPLRGLAVGLMGGVAIGVMAMGVTGCVQDEEDYVPRRQAGFRPPTSAIYNDPTVSVDPAPAPLNPLPDPAPLPGDSQPPLPPPGSNFPPNQPPNTISQVPPNYQPPLQNSSPRSAPQNPPPGNGPGSSPNATANANANANVPANHPPTPAPAKSGPQVAKRVPGKPNQIYNPYTGAILDVTGLTPGTEVRDPRTGETMLVP